MFSRIHDVYLYVYFSNRVDNFSECTQTSSASDLIIAYSKSSISLIVKSKRCSRYYKILMEAP